MQLIDPDLETLIGEKIIDRIRECEYKDAACNIPEVIWKIYDKIPEKKRISYLTLVDFFLFVIQRQMM